MSDNSTNNPNQDAGDARHPGPAEKSVSAKKVEANHKNAQKSTGPRTEAGKAKAASNSYQHGFYAKNLFLTPEQVAKDKPGYLDVAKGFRAHYSPVGYVENLWGEKIATQVLRSARLLVHEQKVLSWAAPLEERSISNLVHYPTSVNRELTWAIEELERLQEIRKGGSNPSEPSDSNEDESLDPEPPTSESPLPDGVPSADPSTGSIPAPAEGYDERLEAAHPAPATHESCGTNPTAFETNGQAATAVQDSDGDVPQESVPSTEPQTPVMGKNSETNPSKSLADQVAEVLDDDDL
ncbi:MAG TPA: hypothetical protein VNO32_00920 [Candidatus Acidoferrum sp.]|jgi:hypothetical protein|nr:hypothetical protein [Candidatus Acidoferrum sp.]